MDDWFRGDEEIDVADFDEADDEEAESAAALLATERGPAVEAAG